MELRLTNPDFLFEVQSLVKAFYPSDNIVYVKEENQQEGAAYGEASGQKDTRRIIIKAEDAMAGIRFEEYGKSILDETIPIPAGNRREYKNHLKHLIYSQLSKLTGKELPWGTLTGVRPTKLIMELAEENKDREEILGFMNRTYDCSLEKADLGYEIVSRELALLREMDYKNGYSIYIGIPFCPTTCLYCSFASYSFRQYGQYVEPYLQALYQEIEYASSCLPGKKLCTVYIGGGTPTSLNERQLDQLLLKVRNTLDFTFVKEFTVEAGRPDSITLDKLKIMKNHGVSRISVNPQTMKQETLDLIGRRHTVGEIREAFHMARETGHQNINMDLIAGLPGEGIRDMEHTLSEIKRLEPDSITIHSLAVKRASALKLQMDKYGGIEYNDVEKMILLGEKFAKENGYAPYYLYRQKNTTGSKMSSRENVGYARYGKEGLYNILIMEEKQTILALGAGGTSKFVFYEDGRLERVDNVKFVKDYVERIDEMIQRKRNFIERELSW